MVQQKEKEEAKLLKPSKKHVSRSRTPKRSKAKKDGVANKPPGGKDFSFEAGLNDVA